MVGPRGGSSRRSRRSSPLRRRSVLRRWSAQALPHAALAALVVVGGLSCSDPADRVGDIAGAPAQTDGSTTAPPATAGEATGPDAGGTTDTAGGAVVAEARTATVTVFAGPDASAAVVTTLQHPTAVGGPLVFHVVEDRPGWLLVDLPLRPNGSTGWIRASEVGLARTTWRIEVRLTERTLAAYDGSDLVLLEPIGVGRNPTPTPGGTFYLYELLQPPDPNGAYGPYAFGLSGFSETLTTFGNGDGRLGIHGTDDPASIGADSTAGCIRLPNAAITQLARSVPLGSPVRILP